MKRIPPFLSIAALLGFFLGLAQYLWTPIVRPTRQLKFEKAEREIVNVEIHPMDELDFWSKDRVDRYRRSRIVEYPTLARIFFPRPQEYQPDAGVFGMIESGKPWWGIVGTNYFGAGLKSLEGPSEESRFVGNPYLLVGVIEGFVSFPQPEAKSLTPYYPQATSIVWSIPDRTVEVHYDITSYMGMARTFGLGLTPQYSSQVDIVAYNARDLGFAYIELPETGLDNVVLKKASSAFKIPQFIHTGPSCGYPGGGNNMSPLVPEFQIKLTDLPARLQASLWLNAPKPGQTPDMRCLLVFE